MRARPAGSLLKAVAESRCGDLYRIASAGRSGKTFSLPPESPDLHIASGRAHGETASSTAIGLQNEGCS
jgi:hypothetical protein